VLETSYSDTLQKKKRAIILTREELVLDPFPLLSLQGDWIQNLQPLSRIVSFNKGAVETKTEHLPTFFCETKNVTD
jgi:hypothetical protein